MKNGSEHDFKWNLCCDNIYGDKEFFGDKGLFGDKGFSGDKGFLGDKDFFRIIRTLVICVHTRAAFAWMYNIDSKYSVLLN